VPDYKTLACALALVVGGCGPSSTGSGLSPDDAALEGGRSDAHVSQDDALFEDAAAALPDATPDVTPDAMPDAMPDAPPPPPPRLASATYPRGLRHSPIDAAIAARLAAIGPGAAHELAKVGDSITASTSFFTCFDGGPVDLDGRTDLAATVSYFLAGTTGGSSSFARYSLAAISGATTSTIVSGSPSPLQKEIAEIDPHFAIIMLGTNDIRVGRTYAAMGADLWRIVDETISSGAIPVLSTIPPNNSDSTADARIPFANLVVRAVAQGRQVPLVDYYREMVGLPSRGISSDGIHPTVSPSGACILTAAGLQYGYNLRNLVSLEAVTRARTAAGGTTLDASLSRPAGTGTSADPYLVTPTFVDLNDDRDHPMVYELSVSASASVHALVVDRDGTNVDVHILQAGTQRASGDHEATASVGAGTVRVVVDTPSGASPGEFLVVVETR
jgi:lysophospholipase L1-like esterase